MPKETYINIPTTHDIKRRAQAVALSDGRTVAGWVRKQIEDAYGKLPKDRK
jgi:hypothetical protein